MNPVDPSRFLRTPSGARLSLAAALRGDAREVDALELQWRNILGPRPALTPRQEAHGLVAVATDILRNFGPRGETVIQWSIVTPCGRCFTRLRARPTCPKCGGYGHSSQDYETFYMTLEGEVLS